MRQKTKDYPQIAQISPRGRRNNGERKREPQMTQMAQREPRETKTENYPQISPRGDGKTEEAKRKPQMTQMTQREKEIATLSLLESAGSANSAVSFSSHYSWIESVESVKSVDFFLFPGPSFASADGLLGGVVR